MNDIIVEYGGALSDLAFEEHKEDEILESARVVRKVISDNPDYIKFLAAPNIRLEEKLGAIDEAFGDIDAYARSFLKIMAERGYAFYIVDCLEEYERLYFANKHISVAKVLCASELTEAQKNRA